MPSKVSVGQVHYLMESVASMDPQDREVMSKSIGVLPWRIDSCGVALYVIGPDSIGSPGNWFLGREWISNFLRVSPTHR